jgi:orotate phosphoribosyltransferase
VEPSRLIVDAAAIEPAIGITSDSLAAAREEVLHALINDALEIQRVKLSSGKWAEYYIDAKRALFPRSPFLALGRLVAHAAAGLGASAVGGMTMGADPVAFAALAAVPGELNVFVVRKERKKHGLQRWVEGPSIQGARVLVVDDVVTSGDSLIDAVKRVRSEGAEVVGALSVLDRLAGGQIAIANELGGAAAYMPLFTIDDVFPERPDR